MKTYTIVAGVNGTGKSSLSGVLKAERSDLGHIIDANRIAAENNYGPVKAGRVADAGDYAFRQTHRKNRQNRPRIRLQGTIVLHRA